MARLGAWLGFQAEPELSHQCEHPEPRIRNFEPALKIRAEPCWHWRLSSGSAQTQLRLFWAEPWAEPVWNAPELFTRRDSNSKLDGTFSHILVFNISLFSSSWHIGPLKIGHGLCILCLKTTLQRSKLNFNQRLAGKWHDIENYIHTLSSLQLLRAITRALPCSLH